MHGLLEYFSARALVVLWIVGFVGAGLALSVDQKRTAARSCWGGSPWQNEIAIWNLGATVMMIGILRSGKGVEPALLPGMFVLSLAFAINHFVAIRRNRGRIYLTNVAAMTANGIGVLAILLHFALSY